MKINFIGAVQDAMGYGEFARNFAASLFDIGAEISVDPISFEKDKTDHGRAGKLCDELSRKSLKPDVNIINMIPPLFQRYKKPNCMNIGFTMFETSRIPEFWVKACNSMDAILVPTQWNKEVFEGSGVNVPIAVACPGLQVPDDLQPSQSREKKEFAFYSIFQWTARKNPLGLIKAYWAEFSGDENVELILKTYRKAPTKSEQDKIVDEIAKLRSQVKLRHYPKLTLIGNLLSRQEIIDLHLNSDCFVLPHRAEGLGMPHMEAMSYGKPVIATGFSGNTEFMNDKNSFLLNYTLTPVSDMEWFQPWYEGNMLWAEPDLHDLMNKMRLVYNDIESAKAVGLRGREFLAQNFTWENCARNLLEQVEQLHKDFIRGK